MNRSHVFFLSALLLVSCSAKKSSSEGQAILRPSEKQTADLSKTTDEELQTQFHSLESKEIRDKQFLEVVEGVSLSGQRLDTKTKNAAVYLASFRFELWRGSLTKEAQSKREALFTDVSKEFMERLQDLTKKFKLSKLSPLLDIKSQNDEFAFYALSIAMDKNLSGLLEKTLKADFDKMGVELHNENLILADNRDIVIGLMEARVNILSALALKLLTNNAKSNLGQKLESIFSSASFGHLKSLDVPESVKGDDEAMHLLLLAKKQKDFLATIGMNTQLEKNLKSAYRHVKSDDTRDDIEAVIKELMK